ncbi:MAG: BatD family protein [Planctomycetota bacterium]
MRTAIAGGAALRQCVVSLLQVAAFVVLLGAAHAQEKLLLEGPEPGTIRLGDASVVRIRIEGAGADPRPFKLPRVDGLTMRLSAPSRTSYQFYDGRRLIQRIGVQYSLELRPQRAGVFEIPPFAIWTGTKEQQTRTLRIEARQDLVGGELGWVEVEAEPKRVFVHEPLRVKVSFAVQAGVALEQNFHNRYRYLDIEVQANWLDDFPGGEKIEAAAATGDTRLTVLNTSTLVPCAFDGAFQRDGKTWQRFSFERSFLPTRLGKTELSAPTLRFRVVRAAGSKDAFGRSRGRVSENFYAYGKPLTVEVMPIPEEGRPTPYFGAVGRFAINAQLDRNAVRVGESVKLRLTIRGRGNTDFLRLPELGDLAGFHLLGKIDPERADGRVVATYDLTPLSTDVTEVPPIGWNFFDTTPGVESFVSVATKALPLRVDALADGETLAPLAGASAAPVVPGVDDVHDLPLLDGPALRVREPLAWLVWLAVLLPWLLALLLFCGIRARRRGRADATGQRVRSAARRAEQSLAGGDEPLQALLEYVGDRLDVPAAAVLNPELAAQLVASGLGQEHAAALAAAIERGTAARYGGDAAGLDAAEVKSLVAHLEGQRFGARVLLLALPLFAAWGLAAPTLTAQQVRAPGAAPASERPAGEGSSREGLAGEGLRLYRAGDFEAADAAFARAFDISADRRLLQARGNSLFRLGRLAEARWAYESARLGLTRSPELAANLQLVKRRLSLPDEPAGLGAEIESLLLSMQPLERLFLCAALMLLAAGCLVFGWRRLPLRWLGLAALVPGALLAVWMLAIHAARPARAIAVEPLALTAEPRLDLDPVASVRPGVAVELTGRAEGDFVLVQAGKSRGYAPRASVRLIR